jgi:hypothetical protein
MKNRFKMRHFRIFPCRKKRDWPLRGPPESPGIETMKTAPTEVIVLRRLKYWT